MKFAHHQVRPIAAKAAKIENIEDLFEDDGLQNVYWTERALQKVVPKSGPKIKKMKSR